MVNTLKNEGPSVEGFQRMEEKLRKRRGIKFTLVKTVDPENWKAWKEAWDKLDDYYRGGSRVALQAKFVGFNEKNLPSSEELIATFKQNRPLDYYPELLLSSSFACHFLKDMLKENLGYDQALAVAQAGVEQIRLDLDKIAIPALNLFIELVEKGLYCNEAIKAAGAGLVSKLKNVRESAINLFHKLFEKNKGFSEALEAVPTAVGMFGTNIISTEVSEFIDVLKSYGWEIPANAEGKKISPR